MQSNRVIKAAIVAAFIAAVCYFGYFIARATAKPLATVLCVEQKVLVTAETNGWIVRREEQIFGYGSQVNPEAEDGEKLGAGDVFATRYLGESGAERTARQAELELKAGQIRELLEGKNSVELQRASARKLASSMGKGEFASLQELVLSVRTCFFGEGGTNRETLEATLADLETQIADLKAQASDEIAQLTTTASGIFYRGTDGYEHVSPDQLVNLSPAALRQLMGGGTVTHADTVGKLVTGQRWYYAALLSPGDAAGLTQGSTAELEFPALFDGTVSMLVESVGPVSEEGVVAVFSCMEHLQQILSARKVQGLLVQEDLEGLRIPESALVTDPNTGETSVFVLEGNTARRIRVTLLGEYDGRMYADPSGELRENMELLPDPRELYDGKVVK